MSKPPNEVPCEVCGADGLGCRAVSHGRSACRGGEPIEPERWQPLIKMPNGERHYTPRPAKPLTGAPENLTTAVNEFYIEDAAALVTENPELPEPVVAGLFRRGETVNFVAPSKTNKTFTLHAGLLGIATGGEFLGFPAKEGNVLLIDNELSRAVLAYRIKTVAEALGLPPETYAGRFETLSLRGQLRDIFQLRPLFQSVADRDYSAIAIDALYRVIPAGMKQNSNDDYTLVYNEIDAYSKMTGAAFILVAHGSKGSQSDKDVRDVGSGAGAMTRAADVHIVMRPHAEDEAVVIDGVLRSFAPIEPFVLRWNYPLWTRATDLDATALKQPKPTKKAVAYCGMEMTAALQKFVADCVTDVPQSRDLVELKGRALGFTAREVRALFDLALSKSLMTVIVGAHNRKVYQKPKAKKARKKPKARKATKAA